MDRQAIAAIAALDGDLRSALHAYVRSSADPVTREAAAGAVGISRKLAAFHLDKLVEAGLLQARIEAVGVPRVGRTPKVYLPAEHDIAVHVPPREPSTLAAILVAAVVGERADERAADAALRVAREHGMELGTRERERVRPGRLGPERAMTLACGLLAEHGFEPAREAGGVRLRNCPFHPHAANAPGLVCTLNHAFLQGVLAGLAADGALDAVLAPCPGMCCVELHPHVETGVTGGSCVTIGT